MCKHAHCARAYGHCVHNHTSMFFYTFFFVALLYYYVGMCLCTLLFAWQLFSHSFAFHLRSFLLHGKNILWEFWKFMQCICEFVNPYQLRKSEKNHQQKFCWIRLHCALDLTKYSQRPIFMIAFCIHMQNGVLCTHRNAKVIIPLPMKRVCNEQQKKMKATIFNENIKKIEKRL